MFLQYLITFFFIYIFINNLFYEIILTTLRRRREKVMKKRFTKKELEILKTLWNSAAPMIASEIAKANNALNLNTVHACLRSLSDKGAIKVDDIVYSGTVLTRSYVPVITSEEYFGDLYNDILGTKKENLLLRSLIDTQTDITELENLEKIIAQKKKELSERNN